MILQSRSSHVLLCKRTPYMFHFVNHEGMSTFVMNFKNDTENLPVCGATDNLSFM